MGWFGMNMTAECEMVWSCREIVIQLSVAVIKKETGTLKKEGRFTLSCGSNSWLLSSITVYTKHIWTSRWGLYGRAHPKGTWKQRECSTSSLQVHLSIVGGPAFNTGTFLDIDSHTKSQVSSTGPSFKRQWPELTWGRCGWEKKLCVCDD